MWRDGGIALLLATACFLIASAEDDHTAKRDLNITVPRWIQNDTEQVILDCEYEYSLDEQNFVVKWYLNDDPTAVYQWIPSENSRMFSPLFRSHVDWEYKLEESDKFTKYRRIVLNHPNNRFGGTYQCSVNSRNGHGVAEAKMDIFAPANNITLTYSSSPDNQVNVTCIVKKIFPKPDVQLFTISSDSDDPKPIRQTSTNIKDNGIHGYDIIVSALLTTHQLNNSEDTTLQCVVQIEEIDYEEIRTRRYHPQPMFDRHNNHSSSPRVSLAFLICIIIAILLL